MLHSALCALAALGLAAAQWFIWAYAPIEKVMGPTQKIFYLHVPLAWWGFASFAVTFGASIAYLVKRKPGADLLAGVAAEVGVVFTTLALITGMLWGRHSWGVWWTWDPRLTTTLIMWFTYAAYLVLRASATDDGRKGLVCAGLGVVAFLDVPLVFYSARMWRSVHPAVFGQEGGGLAPEMLTTLLVSLGAMGLFWLALLWIRSRLAGFEGRLEAVASARL